MDFSSMTASAVADWWSLPNVFKQTIFFDSTIVLKKKKKEYLTECYS